MATTTVAQTMYNRLKRRPKQGFTCQELEQDLGVSHPTASARLVDLRYSGLIVDSGERRKTTSGRNAIVWVVR